MPWRSKQGALKPAALRGGNSYPTFDHCSPFPLLSLCLFLFQNTMHLSRLLMYALIYDICLSIPIIKKKTLKKYKKPLCKKKKKNHYASNTF